MRGLRWLVRPAPRRSAHRKKRPAAANGRHDAAPKPALVKAGDASRFAWLPGDEDASATIAAKRHLTFPLMEEIQLVLSRLGITPWQY